MWDANRVHDLGVLGGMYLAKREPYAHGQQVPRPYINIGKLPRREIAGQDAEHG